MAFSFRKSRLTDNSRRTTVSSQRILLLERVDYEVPLWQYHDATSTVVFESVSPSPQVVPSLVTVDVDEIVVCLSRLKWSEISSYNNFFYIGPWSNLSGLWPNLGMSLVPRRRPQGGRCLLS